MYLEKIGLPSVSYIPLLLLKQNSPPRNYSVNVKKNFKYFHNCKQIIVNNYFVLIRSLHSNFVKFASDSSKILEMTKKFVV